MVTPFRVTLRGTSFRPHPLAHAERLWLCHEPGNPHDGDALRAVTADGIVVGYLPAAVARRVVAEFGPGVCLAARVEQTSGVFPVASGPVRIVVLGRARSAPPVEIVDPVVTESV